VKLRAAIIVNDASQARPILEGLLRKGISVTIESDPQAVLDAVRTNPPDLLIVEDSLSGMTGTQFLSEFLTIDWTTSAILICDEDEEVVHQRTEGLGILGAIRTVDDAQRLDVLIDRFLEMRTFSRPTAAQTSTDGS